MSLPTASTPPHTETAQPQLALLAGLVIVTVWGANFAVQKTLFQVLTPGAFLFVRYLLSPLMAAALLCWTHGRQWPRLPRADLLRLAVLGVIGHGIHVSLVTHGIHLSTAFSSALILACGPLFTLLILHVAGHERLQRGQVVGVAVACFGVLAFMSDKLLARQWAATGGDLVMLFAGSLFSYYTVMSKPLIQRHGSVTVMAYATLAGSPLVVMFNLSSLWQTPWAELDAWHLFLLLWAIVVSAFLGWLIWGWVNDQRGVARSAPLMYLMPLVAGLFAWWATGEQFGAVKLAAAAVTVGGVALAQFSKSGTLTQPSLSASAKADRA